MPDQMTFLALDEEEVAAFPSATAALEAAEAARAERPDAVMAIHTGVPGAVEAGARRARRLREIGRPGQTLVSATAAAGHSLDDLGVHRLKDLLLPERVYGQGGDGGPLRSLDATPNNLPSSATSFVGREAELAELRARLPGTRLLTVTGLGGAGKTRLAAQLAAEEAGSRPDGTWWVELGDVAGPGQVAAAVGRALDVLVDPAQGTADSLRAQLADRHLLLCLDNCEHVLDAAASVASALVTGCPEVTIVATSREPLGLSAEHVWRLPPLPASDARALFVERAAQLQADLRLDDDADAAIASMCTRLDGSPLALELAAAWSQTLSPRQIETGLDDRFALLVRSPRDAVPRHASLLASVSWSHELLEERDKAVFRRLAVFAGGFDLGAARAVTAEEGVLGSIGRLVDKSLVIANAGRYRLPETIREYAADRLRAAGERRATADRHLDHLLARVRAAAPDLETDRDRWRAALAPEHDNLRAAISHGLDAGDPARGRELVAELPWLWQMHRQGREGLELIRRAIARAADERSPTQARLLTGVALVADTAGPLDLEYDAAQRARELAEELGDERLRSLSLALAAVGRFYTDFGAACELAFEAERRGDAFVVDATRALRGIVAHLRDDHAAAERLLGAAAEGLIGHGERGVGSSALAFLSGSALLTGDTGRARELAERSVATAAPLADHLRIGMGRAALALAHQAAGDVEAGFSALAPVRPLIGDVFLPEVNRALGVLHLAAGDPGQAIRCLTPEAGSTDGGRPTYLAIRALPPLAAAQRQAGDTREANETAARGAELAEERGMPAVRADCLEQQGHLENSPDHHRRALAIRVEHGLRPGIVRSLEALAAIGTASEEQDERLRAAARTARRKLGLAGAGTGADADADAMGLEEAAAYASRMRGSRRRPGHGWGSLTPAELEVVKLAVDGLSNPEIGTRLYMSRSTVKAHLSHVYAKLGVANRTELAAQAAGNLEGSSP